MSSLRELQHAVLDSLLGGASQPAAALVASPAVAAPTAVAQERLGIYANNVRANFIASLRSTFPVVRRLVGEEYFHAVARSYHLEHPSTSGDLRYVGRAFAAHLAGLHGVDAYAYLADVARLEWLCEDALLAAEHAPLDLHALGAVAPAEYDTLRFRLHPTVRLFESRFPALRIWRANVDLSREPDRIDLGSGGDRLALLRRTGALEFLTLSRGETALLRAFDGGADFATALARAGEDAGDGDGDGGEFDAGAALRRFVGAQAIVDFRS